MLTNGKKQAQKVQEKNGTVKKVFIQKDTSIQIMEELLASIVQ